MCLELKKAKKYRGSYIYPELERSTINVLQFTSASQLFLREYTRSCPLSDQDASAQQVIWET